MSHNTTSWKSHRSTWRWTAGNDGRSPEGGKARRVGGHPALARQKTVGQHDQGEVPMQPIPAPPLVVVQATLALGVLIELLDGPAAMGQLDEPAQWRVGRQGTEVPFEVTTFARYGTLAKQPAFRPGTDTRMTRRALGITRRPVHAHGDTLFAEDHVVVLPPRDRLPAIGGEGLEDGLGLIQRRWARLLGLAAPARTPWGQERCRMDLVWQAHPKGAADAHDVGDLPVVETCQEGRVIAVARVGADAGKRDAPGPRLIHQGQGELRLGLKRYVRRDADLRAADAIRGPGLGEREARGQGPMDGGAAGRLIRNIVRADDDLAIGDLAQRSGILAGDANGTAPLFGQAGIVQQQEAMRWTLRHQGRHALLIESLGLPGRIGQQMLQAFGRGARHRGGDGVAVLPLQVREQTREVALHTLPTGRAAEEWREGCQVGGEFWQCFWTGFWDNGYFHTGADDFHISKGEYS